MSADVSYLVAFGGGIVSFASPCVLPVVPAYLSVVTGFDLSETAEHSGRRLGHVVADTALFVGGFGAVFVGLGVSATAIGTALHGAHLPLTRIAGGVVIAMALVLAASLFGRVPLFNREARFHPSARRLGVFAAPVLGVAFGLGWTPCITPVLSSVLAIAASERGAGRGAVLLGLYALGLGVPFLAVGCGFSRLAGALRFVRAHTRSITLGAAAVLAGMGVLLLVDRLSWVTTELGVIR